MGQKRDGPAPRNPPLGEGVHIRRARRFRLLSGYLINSLVTLTYIFGKGRTNFCPLMTNDLQDKKKYCRLTTQISQRTIRSPARESKPTAGPDGGRPR